MKKLMFYIVCLTLLGLGVYFIVNGNYLGGFLSLLGLGGRAGVEGKKKADELREEADKIRLDIEVIRKKKKKVENKSTDEEVEYWKNQ